MPRLRLLWGVALLLGACAAPKEPPSWRLFPLERHSPHDGVAVVNQPDGYGLHIYLETDTSFPGVCRPRWLPDPARLFNGNGSTPFSSGLATREEFFDAVARRDVRGRPPKYSQPPSEDPVGGRQRDALSPVPHPRFVGAFAVPWAWSWPRCTLERGAVARGMPKKWRS